MFRLLVLLPLMVGPPGYKHVGGGHGVEVFRQMSSPVIDLYAEGDIDAPPVVVRDVILDWDHASKVTENVGESRIVGKSGRDTYVYQRLKLPVVADRDYTLRVESSPRGQTQLIGFVVDSAHGPQPRKGVVRVPVMQGGWELAPIRGGAATHARYRFKIDLAGSIPKWMVSGGAAKSLPKMFEGVRREAKARAPGYPVAGRDHSVR